MAICYKTTDGAHFLYRVCYCTKDETLARVAALNADKPKRDGLTDLSDVDYFYATEV